MASKRAPSDRLDGPPVKTSRRLGAKTLPVAPMTTQSTADTANVQMEVYVRVRPLDAREQATGSKTILRVESETALTFDPTEESEPFFFRGTAQKARDLNKRVNKNMFFEFNRVFDENSTNEEVFEETTKKVVMPVLEGYNCSVFAYGATGAGKTYTMLGTADNPGIAYRTIVELLNQVEQLDGWQVTLGASYLEVHNENVKDLIHPASGKLQLREEGGQVLVSGLKVETIRSADQLFSLLARGNANRTQYATESNAESSRSHAVFQVHVRMEHVKNQVKLSKLSMIDLAGSERGSVTGYEGDRFKEGSNINKSLLALGNCINALAGGLKHVPYRDSNLTRILKDSLGGNCRTMMIANVSPASTALDTTYKTLNYATRARSIKSNLSKNLRPGTMSVVQYQQLVNELQMKLSQAESQTRGADLKDLQEWEKKIAEVMEEKRVLHQRILKLQSEERLTAWRLKHKMSMVEANDAIDEVTSNRYKRGIDQLSSRLETFQKQIVQSKPMLLSVYNRETALVQEIESQPHLAPFLLQILDKYRYMVVNAEHTMCEEHMQKINQLQAKQVEKHQHVVKMLVSLSSDLYRLSQSSGHMTSRYESEYQRAIRDVDGLKAVSFADDEYRALTENNKLLRLSIGAVHDKPVVSEEAMQAYQDSIPLKDIPLNMNISKPIPLKSLPSLRLTKTVPKSNPDKENSYSARFQSSGARILGTRSTPTRNREGLKAVRNKMEGERAHPYQRTSSIKTKTKPTSINSRHGTPFNPVRMNKIASARVPNGTR